MKTVLIFRRVAALCLLAVLGACATPHGYGPAARLSEEASPHQKIGTPYTVNGVTYYPKADPRYNRVGVASWYGSQFHGRRTANGELFDMNRYTAAHPTLPLPSIVRVTNLENGRSIKVRVNDRGPFAKDRIIDMSRAAATKLGFVAQGTTRVRVEYVGPASMNDAVVALAPQAAPEPAAPANKATLVAAHGYDGPMFANSPELRGGTGGYYVQVAAFADPLNAKSSARDLSVVASAENSPIVRASDGKVLHRVRLGPFASLSTANDVLAQVRTAGFPDARVTPND